MLGKASEWTAISLYSWEKWSVYQQILKFLRNARLLGFLGILASSVSQIRRCLLKYGDTPVKALKLSWGVWVVVFRISSNLICSQCSLHMLLSCEQLTNLGSGCKVSFCFIDLGTLEVKRCTSWCWFSASSHVLVDSSCLFGFLFIS